MVLRWCPCKGSRQMEWCGGVMVSRYREDTGCAHPQVRPPELLSSGGCVQLIMFGCVQLFCCVVVLSWTWSIAVAEVEEGVFEGAAAAVALEGFPAGTHVARVFSIGCASGALLMGLCVGRFV